MSQHSWVLVDRSELEKNKEIKVSNKSESDEAIARKLQNIEICDNVTFIEAKHVPKTILNKQLESVDSDTEDDDISDNDNSLQISGDWEKFDVSGMPVISYNNSKTKKFNKHEINNKKRKKIILHLLSEPEFEIFKERFINHKTSSKVDLSLDKVQERKNYKIETEFFENFDGYTVNIIDRLMQTGIIKNVDKIISITGKSSIILHTNSNNNCDELIRNLILKIFKKTSVEYEVIRHTNIWFEEKEQPTVTRLPRRIINSLASKETLILKRLKCLGVRCPEVISLPELVERHIVVMSFLGENKVSAPKMKHMHSVFQDKALGLALYVEIKEAMRIMYHQANLVHKNLLEHTLLHNNHCYFIDFINVLDKNDKDARNVLYKTCEEICEFFGNKMIKGVTIAPELFAEIIKEE